MNKLLSIIIPMYGVEKYIKNCLDSISKQTYKNLEIICVDDGSRDKSAKIAEEYSKKDNRFCVIHNPSNMGLFRARVEGMKVAHGDYVAFVDADDSVSIDWFRLLMKKITEEDADIVIGNDISINEKDEKYYHNNYRYLLSSQETVCNDDVLKTYYERVGGCYVWHVVWNKIYSKRLVEKCLPYFNRVDYHLIMLEDIAFSSVFYTHAQKLCFANVDAYFYYRHEGASTSTELPTKKIIKNISDVGKAFKFLEESLKSHSLDLFERYEGKIEALKQRYYRIWCGVAAIPKYAKDSSVKEALKEAFGDDAIVLPRKDDFYFYEATTGWDGRQEELKKLVYWGSNEKETNLNIKVVSFDMFDTLITRAVYNPTDIWCFVGKQIHDKIPFITEDNFVKMRTDAESYARSISKKQDITLTEIYESFSKMYRVPMDKALEIRNLENEMEIKYCKQRKFTKEIFDLARLSGRKVIITSDMYLERKTIEAMLEKCGYTDYDNLFLSSDVGLLKRDGDLFKHAAKTMGVECKEILHIGDSWDVDIIGGKSANVNTFFIPKATLVFENNFGDFYTGTGFSPFKQNQSLLANTTVAMSQLPIRCALAVIANNTFDNPFKPFQRGSNYNGDPNYMGYFPLGVYLLGITEWMYRTAMESGYKKIVFLARDGKMLKSAFDKLCEIRGTKIESEYFYATRKSLMPYSVKEPSDFYNINKFMGVYYLTPRRILEMFDAILKPLDSQMETEYEKRGIKLDKKLKDYKAYYSFIDALIDISYSEERRREAWDIASSAFAEVFDENTATFDMGYSGRLQSIICDLSGHTVNAFFDYSNGYNTDILSSGSFDVHTFNDYTPTMASITREFFMSDPAPSCSGYVFEDNKVIPIIKSKKDEFNEESVASIKEMQRAAIDFCTDYWNIYAELGCDFVARNNDYAIAFDYFLLNATVFDRATFRFSMEDDEVYSGYDAISLADIWGNYVWTMKNQMTNVGGAVIPASDVVSIFGVGKIKSFILYLLVDRKTLKEKFKKRMKNHKVIYAICKFLYSIPRSIVHLFRKR